MRLLLPSLVTLAKSHLHSLSSEVAMKNCYNIKRLHNKLFASLRVYLRRYLKRIVVQPNSRSVEPASCLVRIQKWAAGQKISNQISVVLGCGEHLSDSCQRVHPELHIINSLLLWMSSCGDACGGDLTVRAG